MRVTRVTTQLLRLPPARPRAALADAAAGRVWGVAALLVQLDTDAGLQGLGMAYALQSTGRALHAAAADDLAPLLRDEDPLDHERLAAKVNHRLRTVGRRGLVPQAYSAFDVALWDLKGKAANLPLWKLLGGARAAAPTYLADPAWRAMEADEVLDAARPLLDQGVTGLALPVGPDAQADADKVTRVREAVGEDVWLAVDAGERYDATAALTVGRFYEEEIGAGWFAEPLPCEDVAGYARLRAKLEIPLALGGVLGHRDEFVACHAAGAADVLQPDVTRLGGVTPWLEVAALARGWHRPVSPAALPEVGVHLCCGLPGVASVAYTPWLFPLYVSPPAVVEGKLVPPAGPGLGLELHAENVGRYRVESG